VRFPELNGDCFRIAGAMITGMVDPAIYAGKEFVKKSEEFKRK